MEIIAYLIERELLARRNVVLPFIGTLSRDRIASRFAFDRSHLIAPRDTLTLTPDSELDGGEFIELIAAESSVSQSEAIEIYNDWYNSSTDSTGAILTIEAVCSIDLIYYAILSLDDHFAEHLAPLGDEPIAIGRPLTSRGVEVEPIAFDEIITPTTSFKPPISQPLASKPPVTQPMPQRPTTNNRPSHPVQRAAKPRRQGGGSSTALIISIAVATIAAIYIAYYLLSSNGIITI